MTAPGWYPDPTGRFEHRYHNGQGWTTDVAIDGRRHVDVVVATGEGDGTPLGPPPPASGPGNAVATASMVLGIIAVALGWLPFVAIVAIPITIVAGALAVAGRRRAAVSGVGAGRATAGLVLSAVGLVVAVVGIVLTAWLIDLVERYDRPARHAIALTTCSTDDGRVLAAGTLTNLSAATATFNVRVEVAAGSNRRSRLVEVPDVEAGATLGWEAAALIDADLAPRCDLVAVHGPLPFGVDPGL